MTRVLVVDDDDAFRTAVSRALRGEGYDVDQAEDVSAALKALAARRFDVLLTDLRLGERDGIDLLDGARQVSPQTRPILMSAYATARDHQTAVDLGAVKVLCKPFTPDDLLRAIREAIECGVGFRGSVHGLSLTDMLQMFHYARRSLTIEVGGSVIGRIHIRDGQVVHAESARGTEPQLVGEEALRALLASTAGSLRTTILTEPANRSIERPFEELLIDSLRLLDEEAACAPMPEQALERARCVWDVARRQLGHVDTPELALALALDGSGGAALAAGWDDSSPTCRALLDLYLSLAPRYEAIEAGTFELIGSGHGLGLVWDVRAGWAIALGAALTARRGAPWFRSQLAALARAAAEHGAP